MLRLLIRLLICLLFRKLVFAKLMSKVNVDRMTPLIQNEVDAFTAYLKLKESLGESINVAEEIPRCTLNIITTLGFGERAYQWPTKDNLNPDQKLGKLLGNVKTMFAWFHPSNVELAVPPLQKLPWSKVPFTSIHAITKSNSSLSVP